MIVLVCGGRSYADDRKVSQTLTAIHAWKPITLLLEGGATGADHLASVWATRCEVPTRRFPAEWRKAGIYDPTAGPRRNQQMLDEGKPVLVVAFPGGPGTADMLRRAKAAGLKIQRVP